MKNNIKTLLMAGVLLGLMAVGMVGRASAQTTQLATRDQEKYSFISRASSGTSSAVSLFYIGSATEAYVTISSGVSLTFYAPWNTIDTSIGSATSGQTGGTFNLTVSSLNTVGEVCDAINRSANYRCILRGAKSDDNSNLLRDQTEVAGLGNLGALGGWDVQFDTGSALGYYTGSALLRIGVYAIAPNISVLAGLASNPSPGPRLRLKQCKYSGAGTTAAAPFAVYGKSRRFEGKAGPMVEARGDFTRVYYDPVTVSSTTPAQTYVVTGTTSPVITLPATGPATFSPAMAGLSDGLEFADGAHVVVEVFNPDTNGTQGASNFLECLWEVR